MPDNIITINEGGETITRLKWGKTRAALSQLQVSGGDLLNLTNDWHQVEFRDFDQLRGAIIMKVTMIIENIATVQSYINVGAALHWRTRGCSDYILTEPKRVDNAFLYVWNTPAWLYEYMPGGQSGYLGLSFHGPDSDATPAGDASILIDYRT